MSNYVNNLGDSAAALADSAEKKAEQFIHSTQKAANQISDHIDDARAQAGSALNRMATDAEKLTRRGLDALRDEIQALREQSLRAKDSTVGYIRDEPVKSVLIAAAVGAGLMALITLVSRSSGSHH